jgi:hypothetical protein
MFKSFLNSTKLIIFSLFVFTVSFTSCDTLETDLYVDPSALNKESADVTYLLNQMQLSYNNLFESFNFSSSQVTRMELMRISSYRGNFTSDTFDGAWSIAYRGVLINNKVMLEKIQELEASGKDYSKYKAISKILEAGTMLLLVDNFDNVPYSQALQIENFPNPKRDNGHEIYEAAYQKIDEAIALMDAVTSTSLPIPTDLYYGNNGDMAKWKKYANSLKIQMLVNSRFQMANAVSRFNQLVSNNAFINDNADDFQFLYGGSFGVSENRHPIYRSQYQGEASIYMSKNFIDMMIGDPREHYYFYRQTLGGDSFARIHGSTLPNVGTDYNQMTVHGLYPYGGGTNYLTSPPSPQTNPPTPPVATYEITNNTMGLLGAGINPMTTNFSTQFLIAEGQLVANLNPSAARSALEAAVRAHLNKVRVFGLSVIKDNVINTLAIENYVNNMLANYDSSPDKLEVIIREFYKASFGNGVQVYNNYRRTGKPSNLATLNTPSTFVYRMLYPGIYINNNFNPDNQFVNIDQRVWWANPSINLNF